MVSSVRPPSRPLTLTKSPPLCNFAFSCSISSVGWIHPYLPFHALTVPVNFSAERRVLGSRCPLPPSLPLSLPLPWSFPPLPKALITPFAAAGAPQPFAAPLPATGGVQPLAPPQASAPAQASAPPQA